MFKHILVPTDGSVFSEAAIQMAVALAAVHQAKVTGLHVLPEFHILAYGAETLTDTEEQFTHHAQQHAEAYLAVLGQAAAQADVEFDTVAVTDTRPYEAILGAAAKRNCDLIVMASHGRGGMGALILGSETQKVLVHSQIPVLVVRQKVQAIGPDVDPKRSPNQPLIVA
ncbi:universal stress protein [Caballeronia sordidicola]|uniref:Universal stress protein n=1 Tax=Caballeronia sordidicola TaxID=196367 RepID=A0A226WLW6_CABSO|nr:universal stress protein [Caballeronia sordidicola]OXC72181.1 Universal stress protein [Caballeronia sordidicola]